MLRASRSWRLMSTDAAWHLVSPIQSITWNALCSCGGSSLWDQVSQPDLVPKRACPQATVLKMKGIFHASLLWCLAFQLQQKLTQVKAWKVQVSSMTKTFCTQNGIFFVDCREVQVSLLPRLTNIFKEMAQMLIADVMRLSDELIKDSDKLKKVFTSKVKVTYFSVINKVTDIIYCIVIIIMLNNWFCLVTSRVHPYLEVRELNHELFFLTLPLFRQILFSANSLKASVASLRYQRASVRSWSMLLSEANCMLVTCYNTCLCVYPWGRCAVFILFFYCEALTSYQAESLEVGLGRI